MIGSAVKDLLLDNEEAFLVPAENVANVMCLNPLSHALLVLSQVRYSKIPVLDKGDRFVGLISLADVVDKMFEMNIVDFEGLKEFTVADVMEVNIPVVGENWELEDVLHLLVDVAFLPVVDDNKKFKGIITRKEILKSVNHMAHELENKHVILPRLDEKREIEVS